MQEARGAVKSKTQMSEYGRLPRNVLEVATSAEVDHAAAFPVALPDFFIRAYSDEGDTWLDPFCGSGTTIVAAENNKRRGLGIEMLPKYCAVILERMAIPGIEIERIDGQTTTRRRKAHGGNGKTKASATHARAR